MNPFWLIALSVLGTLLVLGAISLLRRAYRVAAPRVGHYIAEKTITLDDFEPNPEQEEKIRTAVGEFERQMPLGRGRLFGVVAKGELVMFAQWRGRRDSEDARPQNQILRLYQNRFPEEIDEDGWPLKPDKIFEINPDRYGAAEAEYVPAFSGDQVHPSLKAAAAQ